MQFNALTEYGCKTIFQEKIFGKNTDRPELKKLLESLRKGDEVVFWKLDRLGRSLRDLVDLVAVFDNQGVNSSAFRITLTLQQLQVDLPLIFMLHWLSLKGKLFVNERRLVLSPPEHEVRREAALQAYLQKSFSGQSLLWIFMIRGNIPFWKYPKDYIYPSPLAIDTLKL